MRKIEVITLFDANCMEIPNNLLSLTRQSLLTNGI